MGNERPEASSQVRGGGAAATADGVAAGQEGVAAGRDVNITYQIHARSYIRDKGPCAYKGMGNPAVDWDLALDGVIDVADLREMLLYDPDRREKLKQQPRQVSAKGLLYPCALLVSGWWESRMEKIEGTKWSDDIQKWLFSGFHSWGPSWDFTWDFEHPENDGNKPSFVAQLGYGDEANSIPVIIPADKVKKLVGKFRERGRAIGIDVGGLLSTVTGVLCHRSHCPEAAKLGLVGGILDFCIWLKPGEEEHKISPDKGKPDVYSGYLWKCLTRSAWFNEGKPLELNQVYFVWEHTNFADQDSVKYNLDSLGHKEAYIREFNDRKFHDNSELVLLQKSSLLVPGQPKWSKKDFYNFFQKDDDI
jgi:hypothetical protein